jgi:8-oxo-dGTP pyrophosphatase MutT (NUDIX family)
MHYPSAKVIVRSAEKPDMVLLIQRSWHGKDYYEPAGGRVEADFNLLQSESLEECARREIAEELGIYVDIKEYLGSYYFFWSIDQKKLSVCAVFEGIITGHDADFVSNKDSFELAFKAAWIPLHDIANGSIKVDPVYVGLETVMKNYCAKQLAGL